MTIILRFQLFNSHPLFAYPFSEFIAKFENLSEKLNDFFVAKSFQNLSMKKKSIKLKKSERHHFSRCTRFVTKTWYFLLKVWILIHTLYVEFSFITKVSEMCGTL